MSALPDIPNHFVQWLERRPDVEQPVDPAGFVSRRLYGEYVAATLDEAVGVAAEGVVLHKRTGADVVGVGRVASKLAIQVEGGEVAEADRVVLALGNFPPSGFPIKGRLPAVGTRFIEGAEFDALDSFNPDSEVFLIGAGLTALDWVVGLQGRGHRGRIHMLSRQGLLPHKHSATTPLPPLFDPQALPTSVSHLVRFVRSKIAAHAGDWRSVIDAIRPQTQLLWLALPVAEQQRFLRHVRSFWDVHRHRCAPQQGLVLDRLVAAGQVQLHTGFLRELTVDGSRLVVEYKLRGSKPCQLRHVAADVVINCTGPSSDYRAASHPLITGLLSAGLIAPDPLHLGLQVAPNGALIGADGQPSDWLFSLGPPKKGVLWESTAVPELRFQARDLAAELLRSLG
eukprot:EG_transcript_5542